jgi:group I intron endonuclease
MKKTFDRVVYVTINKINGKKYVGQDSFNNPNYVGSGKLLKIAIKKYGIDQFEKQILCHCKSKEEVDLMEKFWIKELNTIENGYNIMPGGKGNGYPEYIEKMSNSLKGEKNPMNGRSVLDVWTEKYGEQKAKEMWDESNKRRSDNGKNKGVKPVLQYDKKGNLIAEHESMTKATEITGVSSASIGAVCRNTRKTAGGFVWVLKNKNI